MADVEIQCPYVPSHMIRQGTRLQKHLDCCRRNMRKDKLSPFHANAWEIEICSFNSTHHIHKSKLEEHQKSCPDSKVYVKPKSKIEGPVPEWKKGFWNAPQPSQTPDEWTEDWDAESSKNGSYARNQTEEIRKDHPYFVPSGLTKSEKRKFRKEQVLKYDDPTTLSTVSTKDCNVWDSVGKNAEVPFPRHETPVQRPDGAVARPNNVPAPLPDAKPNVIFGNSNVQTAKPGVVDSISSNKSGYENIDKDEFQVVSRKPMRRPEKVESLEPVSTSIGRGRPQQNQDPLSQQFQNIVISGCRDGQKLPVGTGRGRGSARNPPRFA